MLRWPVVVVWTRRAWLVATVATGAVIALLLVMRHAALHVSSPLSDAVCGRTIVIDPGHGGDDAGARGRSGLLEKDVVFDIATRVSGLLNRVAVYTVLTRRNGAQAAAPEGLSAIERKRLDLDARVDLASKSGADLFISIHANSFPEPVWSGAQVFYHSSSEEARALAVAIQKQLVAELGPNLRKAKPGDDYYVLRKCTVPAVIVEVGFLSNPREEALLADPEYRRRVAEAIFRGTVDYLVDSYERRGAGAAPGAGSDELAVHEARADETGAELLSLADDEAILYFAGPTNFDDDLKPEVRRIPGLTSAATPEERATRVLAELAKGPADRSVLCPTLPRGTRLRSLRIRDGVAYVDFSRELAEGHWGGSRAEQLTIYSIVNTLAELPEVERVQILVEGARAVTIAGHILVDAALEPDFSLVERAE